MIRLLRSLFGSSDHLSNAGKRCPGESFVNAIATADVYVLAAMQSDGLDADTFTPEQLILEVERAARDLEERQGFEAYTYERDGVRCLPFFSTEKLLKVFCGEYSKQRNRVFPFQILRIKGIGIGQCGSSVEQLILNDSTRRERPLSADEKRMLEKLWARSD